MMQNEWTMHKSGKFPVVERTLKRQHRKFLSKWYGKLKYVDEYEYRLNDHVYILTCEAIDTPEGIVTYCITMEIRCDVSDRPLYLITSHIVGDDAVYLEFENQIGMTMNQFCKYHDRIHNKCPKCGCRKYNYVRGMPGEHLTVCSICNTIIDYEFNESEII